MLGILCCINMKISPCYLIINPIWGNIIAIIPILYLLIRGVLQHSCRDKVRIQIFERFLDVVGTMEGTRIWEAHHEKKDAVDPAGNGEV